MSCSRMVDWDMRHQIKQNQLNQKTQYVSLCFQEKDLEKLKNFIEDKKPHVVAVTAENQ